MACPIISLLNKYQVKYSKLNINDLYLSFEFKSLIGKIYQTNNSSYILKINKSYFIASEPIDVLITMLTDLFEGKDISATNKAMRIRSIINLHQHLF